MPRESMRLSYRLNAPFEDHAEHESMEFVRENPELAEEPFASEFAEDYGVFKSLARMELPPSTDRAHVSPSILTFRPSCLGSHYL